MHLLCLENVPILEQLHIEEALLRADDRNWCIVNKGSPTAIVMGISGKADEHINPMAMQKCAVPLIRRFSGGGTVIVDEQTCFYTLIGNKELLDVPCYPDQLLKWTEKLYAPAFEGSHFALRDNDYVIGEKKIGGNAQYISKHRWLHHTSFLWDYEAAKMEYLLMPKRVPAYRKGRPHTDFLCCLRHHFDDVHHFQQRMLKALRSHFNFLEVSLDSLTSVRESSYRRSTHLIENF